jgi:hypothetical protein
VRRETGRREFAALLLVGAVGAALALLATRLEVARVVVKAPHPLPVTTTSVNSEILLPAVAPLAIAALASLAAVLATRGPLRRVTGVISAALGLGLVVSAAARVSAAQVLAAASHANISPAAGAGGGIAPGSTTAGTDSGGAVGSLAGFPAHVAFTGSAWRLMMLIGAALIVVVGVAIVALAARLPAMSARYERSPRPQVAAGAAGSVALPRESQVGAVAVSVAGAGTARGDAASMWESLSAGADPTSGLADDEAD